MLKKLKETQAGFIKSKRSDLTRYVQDVDIAYQTLKCFIEMCYPTNGPLLREFSSKSASIKYQFNLNEVNFLDNYKLISSDVNETIDTLAFLTSGQYNNKIHPTYHSDIDATLRALKTAKAGAYNKSVKIISQSPISLVSPLVENSIYKRPVNLLLNVAGRYGYKLIDVPKDGNCFFHAVLTQLPRSVDETASSLRTKVVNHIFDNFNNYRDFLRDGINDPEDFLRIMGRDGEWVDEAIIIATSRLFHYTIAIVRSDGQEPNIYRQKNASQVIYLGYDILAHYQGLQINKNITNPRINLQGIIHNVDCDRINSLQPARAAANFG